MKKIFASLTAIACAATIFTGCGKVDDDDDKKDYGKKGSSASSSDNMEDVINDIFDAVRNKDMKAILRSGLPDELSDAVSDIAANELDALMDSFSDDLANEAADLQLISIEKTDDMDENYILLLEKAFSVALTFTEYMEENDLTFEDMEDMETEDLMDTPLGDIAGLADSLDADINSIEDLIDSGILDKIDSKITVTEACMAEVTIKTGDETESMELPFYYIKGEGWNSDMIFYPAMIGYVKKSKAASASTAARTLYTAANTALEDMDEENFDTSGSFIIHSDDSLNYNINKKFDVDTFKSYMNNYVANADEDGYFIVVSDYSVEYVACVHNDITGVYPIITNYAFEDYDSSFTSADDYSLDELYEMAVNIID